MGNVVIDIADVAKSFKVYYDKGQSLKERLLFRNRSRHETRTVLDGVSFQVREGEAIGLIGQNGCGKSTMLKLMTRILYPDRGSITMRGRISSLIELGAGFHPDMTGKENIFTNASIFGLGRKEIERRLEAIIDFSELGEFIDNPIRTYSSGMYMRLAFAVAINVDADILLVDEILAVGDANFQAKCFHKLREIKARGTTIVIVSHSLGQIEQICERSIWIHEGKIRMEGIPRDVHPSYMEFMGEKGHTLVGASQPREVVQAPQAPETQEEQAQNVPAEKNRWGNGAARIEAVRLLDQTGKETERFKTGDALEIEIVYRTFQALEKPTVGIGIFRNDGLQCYGTNTLIDHVSDVCLRETGVVKCHLTFNGLLPGDYTLDVALHTEDGFAYDYYKKVKSFQMYSELSEAGIIRLPHTWQIR